MCLCAKPGGAIWAINCGGIDGHRCLHPSEAQPRRKTHLHSGWREGHCRLWERYLRLQHGLCQLGPHPRRHPQPRRRRPTRIQANHHLHDVGLGFGFRVCACSID